MQGFPIGGSRIRLSWGRSQCVYFSNFCPLFMLTKSSDKAAQAAAQAAQAAALHSAYSAPPAVGSLTQDQALQLLQRLGIQYPNPPAATYNGNDAEHSFMNSIYSQQGLQEEIDPPFAPRPEILRTQPNFSPFSPDPNSLYTSSESVKRDLNPYLRFDSFPQPAKPFSPGFFSHSQDLKVNTAVNVSESKVSPASASIRPSSASRYTFAENTDPLALIDGGHGRAGAPISRPHSGQLVPPADKREPGPIHDLNGTLASLDLDRPWRSPEVKGRPFC